MSFASRGFFHSYGLTSIQTWISNQMTIEVWDGNTYPFLNHNGCIVKVSEWINNFIPYFKMDVITYPCWD